MSDRSLLDSCGMPALLPPDPIEPTPPEVEAALRTYREGDIPEARTALEKVAASGRTAASCHATAALAGIEFGVDRPGEHTSDRAEPWEPLKVVVAGEDPWLGPLAAALLTPENRAALDRDLLLGLNAQLTGDRDTARTAFESAAARPDNMHADLADVLLGNLLLTGPTPFEAEVPLTRAQGSDTPVRSAYAGHLLGALHLARDELALAANVLDKACKSARSGKSGSEALHPWLCVRYGELLAVEGYVLDVLDDELDENGLSVSTLVRERFEGAGQFTGVECPALGEIGEHLSYADFDRVRSALGRLWTWSDERYDRARRLVLALYQHARVPDDHLDERSDDLSALMADLALPKY